MKLRAGLPWASVSSSPWRPMAFAASAMLMPMLSLPMPDRLTGSALATASCGALPEAAAADTTAGADDGVSATAGGATGDGADATTTGTTGAGAGAGGATGAETEAISAAAGTLAIATSGV